MNRVWINKRGMPIEYCHAVARHLAANHVHFGANHLLSAIEQVLDRDVMLADVAVAVNLALTQASQMKHCFADRFGGNGAGVNADAANLIDPFDQSDAPAKLGGIKS